MKRIFMLLMLFTNSAFAAWEDGFKYAKNWGVDSNNFPLCAGSTGFLDVPGAKDNYDLSRAYLKGDGDSSYLLFWIAKVIVEHGGYFCEVFVRSQRDYYAWDPYTTYYDASDQHCYWLCEAGYFGENCASTVPTACAKSDDKLAVAGYDRYNHATVVHKDINSECLVRTKKDTHQRTQKSNKNWCYVDPWLGITGGSPNIENQLQMLGYHTYVRCNGGEDINNMFSSDQEHDLVLSIRERRNNTFIAQPLVIRGGGWKWQYTGMVIPYWTGNQKVLCPDGFIVNSKGNECILHSKAGDVCDMQQLCQKTHSKDYNSSIHKIVSAQDHKDTDCSGKSVFRCKTGAFASVTDFSCAECVGAKNGPGVDGTCVKCVTGEFFDAGCNNSGTSDRCCKKADAITHQQMRIGNEADSNVLKSQCWTILDPTEYKRCVLGQDDNNDGEV